MKRLLTVLTIAVLAMLASSMLLAQESPFVGTWKLNLAKSRFTDTVAPKNETRTVTAQGNGLGFSFEGVAADGSHISWSYTSKLDGKAAPVNGSGIPSGVDCSLPSVLTRIHSRRHISKRAKRSGRRGQSFQRMERSRRSRQDRLI